MLILSGWFCYAAFFLERTWELDILDLLDQERLNLKTGYTRFTRSRKVRNIGRFESNSTPVCGNTSQNCSGVHNVSGLEGTSSFLYCSRAQPALSELLVREKVSELWKNLTAPCHQISRHPNSLYEEFTPKLAPIESLLEMSLSSGGLSLRYEGFMVRVMVMIIVICMIMVICIVFLVTSISEQQRHSQ